MTDLELKRITEGILPADAAAVSAAEMRQASLAKPPRSLGRLEDISVRLAGVTGNVRNKMDKRLVAVFSADNGVALDGVAVTPQSVTKKQSVNMMRRKTGMSVLAECYGDDVRVYDVGINADADYPGIINRKVRFGTASILTGPAMTRGEALAAIEAGFDAAKSVKAEGYDVIGIGEMGIGNTTTSAAVLSVLTGAAPAAVTGRGSGLSDEALAHKREVVARAVELNAPDPKDPVGVIASVGGLDIAAMTGAFLGAAYYRLPAVVDGLISITAALAATRLTPAVRDYLFLSHVSEEPGYLIAKNELGLDPMLTLDMRLGEGSGCPLAFQIMRGACAVMNCMAAFGEAEIDDGYLKKLENVKDFNYKK
ncbi:MAG: nicotinate-nucleotide--dimethylbenzimidazole phosphoribosyltransferase [Clostridiales bacterium]|nr:nicotinate-nucleotide--dimethylbenzimidazole phosphoribosyltransferase [Clostridiales bacterium]